MTVVVGVDGSPQSDHALRWAAYLAALTDDDVEAVVAWPPPFEWGFPWIPAGSNWSPADDATKILELSLDRVFGDAIPATLRRRVVEGSAAPALIDISRDATALVVGSRGHGGFAGLLLGSVSAACSEHAACPVLVVHGDTPPPARPPERAVETEPIGRTQK